FAVPRRYDLRLPGGVRGMSLYRNTDNGTFSDVTQVSGLGVSGEALGCAAGDYDNDNQTDLVVGFQGGISVYRNQGRGTFKDVTAETGIHMDGLPLGMVLLDYDHDGDLDLYISRFTNFPLGPGGDFSFPFGPQASGGNLLWRNNGNGTFTDGTTPAGLAGDAPGIGALAADFNNDRAIDLILTGWRSSPAVLTNSREGPFRSVAVWKSSFPAGAVVGCAVG